MTQMGLYGQRVRQFLHLEHEPPSLITRSLRNAEIAVTETLNDAPVRGLSTFELRPGNWIASDKWLFHQWCVIDNQATGERQIATAALNPIAIHSCRGKPMVAHPSSGPVLHFRRWSMP